MGEWTPGELRISDGGSGLDVLFENDWTHLANLGCTSWSYPDDGKNARFRAEAARFLALFLLAPEMAEALRETARALHLCEYSGQHPVPFERCHNPGCVKRRAILDRLDRPAE